MAYFQDEYDDPRLGGICAMGIGRHCRDYVSSTLRGHTQGHQSAIVELPRRHDSLPSMQRTARKTFDDEVLPGESCDDVAAFVQFSASRHSRQQATQPGCCSMTLPRFRRWRLSPDCYR